MELKKTAGLPPLVRGGGKRKSEEAKQIIEALKSGESYCLEDVEDGNVFNALQQRIRSLAKSEGLKVSIRHAEDKNELHFQAIVEGADEAKVEETPNGKSSTKTTAKASTVK